MAADAKLLAQIEMVGDIEEWIVDANCDPDCDAYRGPNGSACARCEALFIANKLTEAGRLLPPGGEVSTQWRAYHVGGFWSEDCATEEEARGVLRGVCDINRSSSAVFAMSRRRVVTTPDGFMATWPWEVVERSPVLSDNSTKEPA